ncbi:S-layer homology domain-containing protein [Fusibacter sp. 3D3]|uniref:S-layer homology domain-containing protein n=1 Tax=Fusibacter sp. 3D3 TaxID=1048380 RepID=UPI000852C59C|nr:S-layer homology domain-containing protein [Fusibacter sp. 3D3]GAU75802.1 alkaline phosphatase isozyme conversion protein precursor [Fusibacter sp. 3D3]
MKLTKILTTTLLTLTILTQIIIVAQPSFASSTPTDIQGHWSEPFVTSLVSQGVISGYPDGTFKPDKTISNVEFLSLTLKAMNETVQGASSSESWDMPIMKRAYELGLVKTGEPMADATNEITREQSATVLYRALQIKEGIQYDQCYTSILDQVIFDHDQIESAYRDSVYSMLQKGVFTGNSNHFDAKGLMTRGASCVVIERVIDVEKRANPSKVENGARVTVYPLWPKESLSTLNVPFENGKPVMNKEQVLSELRQYENNKFGGSLDDFYYYDDFINIKWYGLGYDTYEAKKEAVDSYYETATGIMKVLYNYSYLDDLVQHEKNLRWYLTNSFGADELVKSHMSKMMSDTLVIESCFVTDKSLLYSASSHEIRVRGRLYFIFKSPSKTAIMADVENLNIDQWYYIDQEVLVGVLAGNGQFEWEHKEETYYKKIYLSDCIPLSPLN